jgi:hypothetical protein
MQGCLCLQHACLCCLRLLAAVTAFLQALVVSSHTGTYELRKLQESQPQPPCFVDDSIHNACLPTVFPCLQVYILSRMGNSRAALALIIERLQDIPRAIEFVRLQRDDELIEELIDWALRSADTTGAAREKHKFKLHYIKYGSMQSNT